MKENIDKFDEVFRSKLQHFEVETQPDDWTAIEKRLPARPLVPLYRHLRYWAAAAVITLLMVTGSLYLLNDETAQPMVVQEVQKQTDELQSRMKEEMAPLAADTKIQVPVEQPNKKPVLAVVHPTNTSIRMQQAEAEPSLYTEPVEDIQRVDDPADVEPQPLRSVEEEQLVETRQASTGLAVVKEKTPRKWRFGMGGGGLSMGAGNVVPQYVTQSAVLRAENLQYMNKAGEEDLRLLPKTEVEHKIPISFGLTVSRSLNNRFALQTGVTYSYLLSKWETNGTYHGKTEQGLHYIGIPVSLTYLIAQWQRFNFYATGGGSAEMNVAGRLNTKLYEGDDMKSKISEDVRMKSPLWSLNARVGVSYPLLRFLSAYAEGGAGYYFDNGSDIETIRSEKPFDLNFQFGLRVGF